MSEEEKGSGKNWYGDTDAQQKERSGSFFPSFSGEGFESHELFRPQTSQERAQGAMPYCDQVLTKDLKQFLYSKFDTAVSEGKLFEVYGFYIDQVAKANVFSDVVIKSLEDFKSEIKKARGSKGQRECLEELREYFREIKTEKRG